MYKNTEFAAALERIRAEVRAKFPLITVDEALRFREYAKSHTDLHSDELTAEQAAWKFTYGEFTKTLRQDVPDVIKEVERREFLAALADAKAEFLSKTGDTTRLTFKQTYELREYAKSRTNLWSDDLTPEQTAWKVLYDSMTDQLRDAAPDTIVRLHLLRKQSSLMKRWRSLSGRNSTLLHTTMDSRFRLAFY